MKEIPLTQGKVALVDDEDYEKLRQHRWYCDDKGYARRVTIRHHYIFMHREIMGDPEGMEIDHINCNPLDNRRTNLRICTSGENRRNTPKWSTNKSGFKGVCWDRLAKKWNANIYLNRNHINLGNFHDPVEAARAYDAAAVKYFGEFARLNFPQD